MIINKDLRQRHLLELTMELKRRQPPEWEGERVTSLPVVVYYDVYTKSALAAGWIEEVTEEEIDDMTFQEMTDLVTALDEIHTAATTIKKN